VGLARARSHRRARFDQMSDAQRVPCRPAHGVSLSADSRVAAVVDEALGAELAEASVMKECADVQLQTLASLDKLNARLRKDYDAAKTGNKARMRQLQATMAELGDIEMVLTGADRRSGAGAASDALLATMEAKVEDAQASLQASSRAAWRNCSCRAAGLPVLVTGNVHAPRPLQECLRRSAMYEHMMSRMGEETKGLEAGIASLTAEVQVLDAQQSEALMTLQHAKAQRHHAAITAASLARHLETSRAKRRVRGERVAASLSVQAARMEDVDDKEKARRNLALMPRVSKAQ